MHQGSGRRAASLPRWAPGEGGGAWRGPARPCLGTLSPPLFPTHTHTRRPPHARTPRHVLPYPHGEGPAHLPSALWAEAEAAPAGRARAQGGGHLLRPLRLHHHSHTGARLRIGRRVPFTGTPTPPHPTPPYPTLHHPTPPYPTLHHPTPPYPTLPHPTPPCSIRRSTDVSRRGWALSRSHCSTRRSSSVPSRGRSSTPSSRSSIRWASLQRLALYR